MPRKNQIPPMEQPGPKPRVLKITKQQVEGIKARLQAQAFGQTLDTFLSGIVAGHGLDTAQVLAVDDEKLTLTIQPK